ncbi:hypothetical protein CSB09_04020 [Candidatus Gracilibacteria bacterium]|nr:MAG: hypothetical protein CSB09_04020 [Candidatus Gracilibacteria bacterium]
METIFFKQRSQKKSMLLFVFYCFFILLVTIFIGSGQGGILDFINSFNKPVIPTIIIAIPLLFPILYLKKFTKRTIEINLEEKHIVINDKEKRIEFSIRQIDCIKIHEPRANTLNLYSQGELLYSFDTGENDGGKSLTNLAESIIQKGHFEKVVKKKKIIGGEMDTFEYTKK